ncbi:hypothetical protein K491DRAFT_756629 [Lophiostoma macrostomum CBS 122681]|uniref:Uncharacterized protein n=1 Tax=Lophiostoma macrostomum CBS 122681 TaxID=1314788 RepID=A0A6A6TEH1_9PLEO|nr:hypothetical protein K491DRAFT_756629 [Lophiostoma macrostomum CBS 122681]
MQQNNDFHRPGRAALRVHGLLQCIFMIPPIILTAWLIRVAIKAGDNPKMSMALPMAIMSFIFLGLPAGIVILINMIQHLSSNGSAGRMLVCEVLKSTIVTVWLVLLCGWVLRAPLSTTTPIVLLEFFITGVLFYLPLSYAYRAWQDRSGEISLPYHGADAYPRFTHDPRIVAIEVGVDDSLERHSARIEREAGRTEANTAGRVNGAAGAQETESTPLLDEWVEFRK